MEASSFHLLVLSLVFWWPRASGHSYLAKPPARNVVAGDNCMHCLQAGGPNTVKTRGRNVWPTRLAPDSHGLCGDPVQGQEVVPFEDEPFLQAGSVQATYTAGSTVEFQIGISTHHMGHYEFRICEQALDPSIFKNAGEGQACLDKWVLHRAPPAADCQPNGPADCQPLDESHPERWYLPPPNYQPTALLSKDSGVALMQAAGEYHTMRFVIPTNLTCTRCTLQWYWATGNSCLYDEDYIAYFKKMQALGWDAGRWAPQAVASWATKKTVTCGPDGKDIFGEEFWNCADIRVNPASSSPTPSPSPGVQPVPSTTSSTTTDAQRPCSALYQQCGGTGWTGHTCCQFGSNCQVQSEWYHQCLSGSKPSPSPLLPTPSPIPSPPPSFATTTIQMPSPSPTPSPLPSATSCGCEMTTAWDGRFSQYVNGSNFCSQNFGGATPYISAGGGSGSSGGFSGSEPCTSGQYSFSHDGVWMISMSAGQAQGKVPYRAFAYAQFCNGQQYSSCWGADETLSFSFSLMVSGLDEMGAYVKLLFWTDSGNILGLLPPNHPKGNGDLRLLAFMNDDYPNSWRDELVIHSGSWYHVRVDFTPRTQGVAIFVNGVQFSLDSIPVNMLGASNGPQVGIYSFDFGGGSWPSQSVEISLSDACMGKAFGTCPSRSAGLPFTSRTTKMPQGTTALTTVPAQATTAGSSTTEMQMTTTLSTTSTETPTTPKPLTTTVTGSTTGEFSPINGGISQACRGASKFDNRAEYFQVSSESSLENCKVRCRTVLSCQGIEYNTGGRCEVWVRNNGIEATYPLSGFTCLRYRPNAATTSPTTTIAEYTSCGQLHDSCGGESGSYQGPTCCASGLECKHHSSSYSQCVMDKMSGYSCSQLYEQCGGKSWTGFQCCAEGLVCVWGNEHFSQCLRRPGSLLQGASREQPMAEDRPAARKPRLRSSKSLMPLESTLSFLQQRSQLNQPSVTHEGTEL